MTRVQCWITTFEDLSLSVVWRTATQQCLVRQGARNHSESLERLLMVLTFGLPMDIV